MEKVARILVVHELRTYRDTVAAALRALRPDIEVYEAESADLDREVLRLRPTLVICCRITELAEYCAPNWVQLYPDHEAMVIVNVRCRRSTISDFQFPELVSIVDEVFSEQNSEAQPV